MITSIIRTLWGDLTKEDLGKFGLLAVVFFLIIGAYWTMRTMKNAIFMKVVGSAGLPYATIVTMLFMVIVVMAYAKLVDVMQKHTLLYAFAIIYGCVVLAIAYFLNHPTIGIPNPVVGKFRLFGWLVFLAIESFVMLACTLFWSFVASSMDTLSAKRGYPIILFAAQVGSLLGCSVGTRATKIGLSKLLFVAALGIFLIPVLIRIFVKRYSVAPVAQVHEEKATGLVEGLRLLLTKPYVMGIFVVATIYEIIGVIFEYQLNVLENHAFHSASGVTEFEALFGVMVNTLSLCFTIFGTSFLLRNFGLRVCLVVYPLTVACAVCFMWAFNGLWTVALGLAVIKGLSYALNNPSKEILYIPTSRDVKFKAKSWIDIFGNRFTKGLGSGVNALFPVMSTLVIFGSLISLGLIGFWIAVAVYVGRKNHALVVEGKIIE